ncbi:MULTISPECIES: hypothetical protein [unclassified Caballeronia]|uniref:hypothetical protein n=1 Tax=unclassified Caballeronia TaxID=2646786 RepID=UPI0028625596|nr:MULTISPECIES: hypothetical protein [unclassified Caballeronia]MDR5774915.1 hypothetical protein [Caballeronia sp. LZ002]MDR5850351.1 hypothetical protein [Caballeronia sp. LZ003]
MSTLQKVNLGTPPTAVDGDTVRGANTKANANVDVLNAQATLTSAAATITSAQALTAAHVGKRVNVNLASPGTINVPSAATMGLDGLVHLRNLGATAVTLAIAAGSGDTIALTKLNAGESASLDSDGVHAIGCLFRGRTNSDNEIVNGTLTVTGGFATRPAINGNTLWDTGNLPNPASSVGMTSGAAVPAGAVGQILQASQPSGGLTANAVTNVIAMTLPPGNYLVWTVAAFAVTSGSASDFTLGVSATSGAFTFPQYTSLAAAAVANTISSPMTNMNVSANTTIFAVARCGAAASINCRIYALRIV